MTPEIERKHRVYRMLKCAQLLAHWEELQVCSQCGSLSYLARARVCPVCHGYRFTTGLPVVWAAVQEAKEHAFPTLSGTVPRLTVDNETRREHIKANET